MAALSYEALRTKIEILGVDTEQAAAMVGRKSIFDLMCKAHWIEPICAEHKCTLYSAEHIRAAFAKLTREGYQALKSAAAKHQS